MKKFFVFATVTVFVAIFSVSCKKDNPVPQPSIVGFWKGKYGINATYPNHRYVFLFRNDGTVRVFDNTDTVAADKGEGTYTQTGGVVKTTYKYLNGVSQYSTKALMDSKCTFMEGTWGSAADPTNAGKFFLNKQ